MKADFLKEKYLLFKAKNKDPESFSSVYDLFADRIYRFVYFKISNKEDAQDLTSEVFLKTWQYITDGKEIKNLNALFYKIARNLVIDYYRKASRKDIPLENGESGPRKELMFDNLREIETKLEIEKIEDKLKDLKDEYREVIILRYIEDLTISQIAQILEKKKSNIRVILYRALNVLRELMTESKE